MNSSPHTSALALAIIAVSLSIPVGLSAQAQTYSPQEAASSGKELPPYLQCVPYAREVTGIDIYGDALTWWEQAAGRYERGGKPRVGAVMAFSPTETMRLGHVAAVARVIDSRTVLLDHANWSPINGQRGQIERGVKAVDVSPNNDWSEVRVWYHPLQALGTTRWPVRGFIYPDGKAKARPQQRFAQARPAPARPQPARAQPSRSFLAAFSGTPEPRPVRASLVTQQRATPQPQRVSYARAQPLSPPRPATSKPSRDVAARAVALYD
tara:strand:- start:315 stop:1115 length:801 start_codon:yes stop_codon:yes gene_type:complete